jgi:hypothetical protein
MYEICSSAGASFQEVIYMQQSNMHKYWGNTSEWKEKNMKMTFNNKKNQKMGGKESTDEMKQTLKA